MSIVSGDDIAVISAEGTDSAGSPPYQGAKILFDAAANWDTGSSNYHATNIKFFTQDNSGTDTIAAGPRLTIGADGASTFAGNVTANVGTFNSDSGGTGLKIIGRSTANAGALRYYQNNGTTQTARIESNDSIFEINSISNLPIELKTNNTTALTIRHISKRNFCR